MNGPSGQVGRAVRQAAALTVDRAKRRVNYYGRVDTGWMRDSIRADYVGSNQYHSRFVVASQASYAVYQHEGTARISPAPFLRDAIEELRPADFGRKL